MLINKSMIDLIKEIRRHCEPDVKPNIKLANPDVLAEILLVYHQSNDVVLKALVKELCLIAGPPWLEALIPPQKQTKNQKMYRGATLE